MLLLTLSVFEDNWDWLPPLTVCTRCSLMRKCLNTKMLTNTLCKFGMQMKAYACRHTQSFPLYLQQYIPVKGGACLFELLCLLKAFQRVFSHAEGGAGSQGRGGWAWGHGPFGLWADSWCRNWQKKFLVCPPEFITRIPLRHVQTCQKRKDHFFLTVLVVW